MFFDALPSAEGYLEPEDVRAGEYTAFDAEGRLLRLRVVKEKRPWFFYFLGVPLESVVIEPAETEPQHREDLRRLLIDFLERADVPLHSPQEATLGELLQKAVEVAGWTGARTSRSK